MKKMFYIGVLLGSVILVACTAEEETEAVDTPVTLEREEAVPEKESKLDIVQEAEAAPLELTQQQKEGYHKRYVDVVEWLNEQKAGLHMEVLPIEEFKDEYWQDPDIFEKEVRDWVGEHLAKERKFIASLQPTDKEAKLQEDGAIAKKAYMYISDVIYSVKVAANFETQYSEAHDRQLFAGVDDITTEGMSNGSDWEQTSVEVSLIDGGRTYSVEIEGVWSGLGTSFEKTFTIEFRCDQYGNIY